MSDLPAPSGWFAVAFAHDLRPGDVRTSRLAGEELVLWRGRDGVVGAVRPSCPHLGAHLGDGSVVGGALCCPFHGVRFAPGGECVGTGGLGAAPASLRAEPFEVREREGAILVWHDPAGGPPGFEVPAVDVPPATAMATARFELDGHPVSTSENSVDLAHLAVVHGYDGVRMISAFETDGPVARVSYEMRRPLGLPGTDRVPLVRRLRTLVHFDVTLHGLGVSVVEAHVPSMGASTRQVVLATPTGPGRIELRIGMRVLHARPDARMRRVVEHVGARVAMAGFRHDVRQDLPIWSRQRFVERPALVHGDGPIVPYRRWAQQFLGATDRTS